MTKLELERQCEYFGAMIFIIPIVAFVIDIASGWHAVWRWAYGASLIAIVGCASTIWRSPQEKRQDPQR